MSQLNRVIEFLIRLSLKHAMGRNVLRRFYVAILRVAPAAFASELGADFAAERGELLVGTIAAAGLDKHQPGRRALLELQDTLLDDGTPEFVSDLAAQFSAKRGELMAGCIVAARPDLVERELACRVPRIALRQECYAQEGEDLLLARMFGDKRDGFYVDVGAHHPIRFSNTYLLYSRGWRGINIDASPGSIEEFKRLRPDDVNIECLIACTKEPRTFYLFSEPALNTGSAELAKARDEEDSIYKKVGKTVLQPRTLASLLGEHVAEGRTIDLLNVDVEGLDLEVLHSNDWNRFRPKVVLVEVFWNSDSWRNRDDISDYMIEKGYRLRARFYNTALFQMAD